MATETRYSVCVILALSCAMGCSDYWLGSKQEDALSGDSHHVTATSTEPIPLDVCDEEATAIPGRVAIDEHCKAGGESEIAVEVEWSMPDFDFHSYSEYSEILMTPVVGQLTDDNLDGLIDASDIPDIVVISDKGANAGHFHGVLRIIDGAGTGIHTSVNHVTHENTDYHPYQYSNVALGDIDADGLPEIVLVTGRLYMGGPDDPDPPGGEDSGVLPPDSGTTDDTGGGDTGGGGGENPVRSGEESPCRIAAFTHEGAYKWALDDVPIACGGHAPALADLEGDGSVEVLVGNLVINGETGELLTQIHEGVGTFMAYPEIGYHSIAADLNNDGLQEIITGHSIHESSGQPICLMGQVDDGFPAVADIDGDGDGDVVSVGDGQVSIFDLSCQLRSQFVLAGEGNGGPPTLADMDGDGQVEIGIADATHYAVYEADGSILWKVEVTDESSHATGSSVFDFDGDGSAEILYADETDLWIFDGATGSVRYGSDGHSSRTLHEYPVIADVDGDNEAEIVVVNGGGHADPIHRGLFVLGSADDSWRPARPVWNQHAYSITNIGEDLSIPSPVVSNWPDYNSFRSGSLTDSGDRVWVDAVPIMEGICTEFCDEGEAILVVRLGNSGTQDLPAGVPFTIYALHNGQETVVSTLVTTAPIAPGQTSAGYHLSVDPMEITGATLRLAADDDGTGTGHIEECNEDNNVWVLQEALCP